MTRNNDGPFLSAIFVDYDNIYLSLKRKDEEAARRFAKEAPGWMRAIEQGTLITSTNSDIKRRGRRIVMSRCYGNPVPRRNTRDNTTDMNSFPFVRHHFLRAGFEIIDCPPLTAQLKNSSDIRMVMDMRDYLTHETRFDEFIILSSDADFTPVLQRLRAHARATVIFANEHTATPYTAICDGEIREADLAKFLVEGQSVDAGAPQTAQTSPAAQMATAAVADDANSTRAVAADILAVVIATVEVAEQPVPIETLADRAQRALGSERTVGSNWAGAGSFRTFLAQNLPERLRLTEQPPYLVSVAGRTQPDRAPVAETPAARTLAPIQASLTAAEPPAVRRPAPAPQSATALQQSVARIHEACQAPPLAPPEYRMLFELLSAELREFTFNGDQTVSNVAERARRAGFTPRRDDIRFVIDVVREADPYFEQGVSPQVFAGRFRNFVVARCRGQGMQLSSDEIDLIDAWFTGGIPGAIPRHGAEQQVHQQPAYANGGGVRVPQPDRRRTIGYDEPQQDDGRYSTDAPVPRVVRGGRARA